MYVVFEKRHAQKQVAKAPREIVIHYEAWKRIVELGGPDGLRNVRGFRDESLKGEWQGFRSSRLGLKWRVIYLVKKEILEVYVMEINPHEY